MDFLLYHVAPLKFLCVLSERLCNVLGSGHDSALKNLPEANVPQGGSREFANIP